MECFHSSIVLLGLIGEFFLEEVQIEYSTEKQRDFFQEYNEILYLELHVYITYRAYWMPHCVPHLLKDVGMRLDPRYMCMCGWALGDS